MLLVTSGFAAIVRGITSLNGAWDPEATWLYNHSIFGRVFYGLRPRPIIPRSRGREDSAFASFSLAQATHKHCPHNPGFFGRGLGRGRMDSKGWTICIPPEVIESWRLKCVGRSAH
ncbi:unnamed protein product [Prunus brigantina]